MKIVSNQLWLIGLHIYRVKKLIVSMAFPVLIRGSSLKLVENAQRDLSLADDIQCILTHFFDEISAPTTLNYLIKKPGAGEGTGAVPKLGGSTTQV